MKNNKPNILVTLCEDVNFGRFITDKVKKELSAIGNVTYNELGRPYTKEELRDALVNADIAFAGWGTLKYDEEVLSKAENLKLVAYTGGSVVPIASDALYSKNIRLLSGNYVFAESVAEGTLAYIMASLRNFRHFIIKGAGWKTDDEDSEKGIMDRMIGIVGFGMIGKFFAKMLAPFHVNIKIYSSYITDEEAESYGATVATLDEIFETCDIISIHSGLNDKNYHLVGEKQLKIMKDGALIVNTARGAVIDEEALIRELATGRINAALDVYEVEPLPEDSPLRNMENALLLPHLGGPTIDRQEYVTLSMIEDIKKWLNGENNLKTEIAKSYAANMTDERKFMKR